MPGPTRINVVGMLCSFVGHAALLGGFLFSIQRLPPHALGTERSSSPLVMELIPLNKLADEHSGIGRPSRTEPMTVGAEHHNIAPNRLFERSIVPISVVSSPTSHEIKTESVSSPGSTSQSEFSDYQRVLYEIVARNSRYPGGATRLHLAGVTKLAFRLGRLGNVTESWIQESSGSEMLDDAALEALERAQPLPPIPPDLPSSMDFVIEIDSSVMQQLANRTDG